MEKKKQQKPLILTAEQKTEVDYIMTEIDNRFSIKSAENFKLRRFESKINEGKATQEDMTKYAREIGECISSSICDTFRESWHEKEIPYWLASKSITPSMQNAHAIITQKAVEVQKIIDRKNGVGLNPIEPEYTNTRIHDLVWKTTKQGRRSYLKKEEQINYIEEPIVNCCESFYDKFIEKNAEFRARAGRTELIIRIADSNCCEWCAKLAGKYNYLEVSDTGNDVFRRHKNCHCTVLFADDTGSRQNVHTKDFWYSDDEMLRVRKTAGVKETSAETLAERKTAGLTATSAELLAERKTAGLKSKTGSKKNIDITDKENYNSVDREVQSPEAEDRYGIVLPKQEYAHVMSEIQTHLTEEQKQARYFTKYVGKYMYTVANHGFGEYEILAKTKIK